MQRMKRFGNIWPSICDEANVRRAVSEVLQTTRVSLRRSTRRYVNRRQQARMQEMSDLESRFDEYVTEFRNELLSESYSFGEMVKAEVREPKLRKIDYPVHLRDRVYHHALMNVAAPFLMSKMTADTYSSMKGRGLMSLSCKLKRALMQHPDWYYVQTDFHHFYESIRHDIMKEDLRRTFKDGSVLRMFDAIIDNHPKGLAIGVGPSAYLANLYLSQLDHQLKEKERVPFVFRYMDNIVCLVPTKAEAHRILGVIRDHGLSRGLELNKDWCIAPVRTGIDMCGYVFFPAHTRLRKSLKIRMKHTVRRNRHADDPTFKRKLAPHFGWCKHANCRHLLRVALGDRFTLFEKNMQYKRLSDIKAADQWFGLPRSARRSILDLVNREIIFFEYKEVKVRGEDKVAVRFAFPENDSESLLFLTRSEVIKDRLAKTAADMPFIATIRHDKNYFYFE